MFQVHQVDRDTHVLRMSKCANFEAPFLYLLVGERRALLLDSGAWPDRGVSEVRRVVDGLLQERAVDLIVAHSHGHDDHRAGDELFRERPQTTIVGATAAEAHAFFGLDATPEVTFDLGGRALRVLAIPGHEAAHIAVWDPRHRLLLTGDTLYPGMLTIRDWLAYRTSVERLHAFAQTHPVDWILGAHVEMTRRPGEMYALGTRYQPEEHLLPLGPQHLRELVAAVRAIGEQPRRDVHDAFILEPAAAPPDPATSR
jgi:glyoxylase-like metal-dependent hydrolase (beta-lactamase superfamily II)